MSSRESSTGDAAPTSPVPGWRPGAGLGLPQCPELRPQRKLSSGAEGEVWLAWDSRSSEYRLLKLSFAAQAPVVFRQQWSLSRRLNEQLGGRDDLAHVVDAQLSGESPHFLALEHGSEGNLATWSRGLEGLSQLPLADRLALIQRLATAVAAIHSVAVVHGDLRPGNVLVFFDSGDSRPSLPKIQLTEIGADPAWGVGEPAVEPIAGVGSTADEARLYEAPELQERRAVGGAAATTQADVFALGVMLYQCVVGDLRRPLAAGWERDVGDDLLRELISDACRQQPEQRPGAGQLAQRLQDLETERVRRQHLRSEQLEQERQRQEVRQWQARRRLFFLTALVLTVFIVGLGALGRRIDGQVQRANHETETADTVSEFLAGVFRPVDPWRSPDPLAVADLLQLSADRARRELVDRPLVQGRLLATLGAVEARLGLFNRAEESLADAWQVLKRELGEQDPEAVTTLLGLAELDLIFGRHGQASDRLHRALELLQSRLGVDSPELVAPLKQLGSLAMYDQDWELAESYFDRVVTILRRSESPELGLVLAESARVYRMTGRHERWLATLEEAQELHEEALPSGHPALGRLYAGLGNSYVQLGNWQKAEDLLQRARAIVEPRMGSDHPYLAAVLSALGEVYLQKGDLEAAEQAVSRSIAIVEPTMGRQSPFLRAPLETLADTYQARGDRQKEIEVRTRIRSLLQAGLPADDSRIAEAEDKLAKAQAAAGKEGQ